MKIDIYITVASWEDRFYKGFFKQASKHQIEKVLMFYYEENSERTSSNRKLITDYCQKNKIHIMHTPLTFLDYTNSWVTIYQNLIDTITMNLNIIIDISTMPRETIWSIFSIFADF